MLTGPGVREMDAPLSEDVPLRAASFMFCYKPKVFVARNGKQLAPQPDDHSVQKFLSFAVCEKLGIENRQAYSASAVGSVKQEEELVILASSGVWASLASAHRLPWCRLLACLLLYQQLHWLLLAVSDPRIPVSCEKI
ncbi:hypothetical protein CB1_001508020 [Camelus ferus]|nr:hypothetical protein CB1_001508020 [Camelus ferus]